MPSADRSASRLKRGCISGLPSGIWKRARPATSAGHRGFLPFPRGAIASGFPANEQAMPDKTLIMLLDDVRQKTLNELKGLDETHARWAPPGLQNSCLWHGGHAYFVTEFLTMKAIGKEPQLPEGWLKMFSWESNPAHTHPESWPSLDEIRETLISQHQRIRAMLSELTSEQLDAPEPGNPSRSVRFAILHGIHDEARHSGEISLLKKMMLKTFVVKAPSLV